jgi:hypothetical protein
MAVGTVNWSNSFARPMLLRADIGMAFNTRDISVNRILDLFFLDSEIDLLFVNNFVDIFFLVAF